jgi:ribosomal protein L11 methyltransferase
LAEYLELNIEPAGLTAEEQDQLLALMADLGFEGFWEEEGRILAYIQSRSYDQGSFKSFLHLYGFSNKIKSCKETTLPDRNWNEIWERDYPPVQVSGNCRIRAPFHPPSDNAKYDLVISPKMSFGTAHHETTRLMLETILEHEWSGKKVLDFGCGTGILAILAEKMGARYIIALDNDPLSCENAFENIKQNTCSSIRVVKGELGSLDEYSFHAILGNINLNVLLAEMHDLSKRLEHNGIAILSGFYLDDMEKLNRAALDHGLSNIGKKSLNHWTVAVYRKGD